MSATGYLIWFVITVSGVVALLVVGMVMATGSWERRRQQHRSGDHSNKTPPAR